MKIADAASSRLGLTGLLVLVVSLGIFARVCQWASNRSFWHDEAFLIANLQHYPLDWTFYFRPLLATADSPQAAPPAFLFAQVHLYRHFGNSELALRIPALAAGCLCLAFFAFLAWSVLRDSPAGCVLAVALCAFSDRLIWHSAEVKPYSLDFLICAVLTYFAWKHQTHGRGVGVAFGLAGAVGFWFSYGSVFLFAGLGGCLILTALRTNLRAGLMQAAAMLPACVSLAVLWYTVMRNQSVPGFTDFYADQFPTILDPADFFQKLVEWQYSVWNYSYRNGGFIVGILAVTGLCQKDRWRAFPLPLAYGLSVTSLLAAVSIKAYALDGSRLSVFIFPLVFLSCGAAWPALAAWLASRKLRPRLAYCAIVLPAVAHAAFSIWAPRTISHVRPAFEVVRAERQPGDDLLAVSLLSHPDAFCCYLQDQPAHCVYCDDPAKPDWQRWLSAQSSEEPSPAKTAARTWIVVAYKRGKEKRQLDPFLASLQPHATVVRRHDFGGGTVLLVNPHATSIADPILLGSVPRDQQ